MFVKRGIDVHATEGRSCFIVPTVFSAAGAIVEVN